MASHRCSETRACLQAFTTELSQELGLLFVHCNSPDAVSSPCRALVCMFACVVGVGRYPALLSRTCCSKNSTCTEKKRQKKKKAKEKMKKKNQSKKMMIKMKMNTKKNRKKKEGRRRAT